MRKDLVCSECGKPLRECPPPKKKGISPKLIGIIAAVVIIIGGVVAYLSLGGSPQLPTAIKLDKEELVMKVGETQVIVPTVEPEGVAATFIFKKKGKNIELTSGGEVTAKETGEATILVKCEENPEISAFCKITIEGEEGQNGGGPTNIEKISIDGKDFTLKKGDKKQLKYLTVPESKDENPIWESSDEAVAMVSADGMVTAIKKGSAKITVKAQKVTSAPITVTVSDGIVPPPPQLSYGRYSGDRNAQGQPHGFGDVEFTKHKLVTGGTYAEPGYKIRNGRFVNGKLQSGTLYDADGNKVCFVDANNNL